MLASDLRYALDSVAFTREELGIPPDPWQAEILQSNDPYMLLNCSRQAGKSTTSAALATHMALYTPKSLTLVVSPSERQSRELFRKIVDFMDALKVRPELVEDNKLSCELKTGSRIVSLPSSEGTIRGFSAVDLVIEDEAARVEDRLYNAVRPMLAVSGGRLMLMSTPFGKRGHFFEAWENGGDSWKRISIPADQCPRIPPAFLEEERKTVGDWWFRQEYMCEFVETEDQFFTYGHVTAAMSSEVRPLEERWNCDV